MVFPDEQHNASPRYGMPYVDASFAPWIRTVEQCSLEDYGAMLLPARKLSTHAFNALKETLKGWLTMLLGNPSEMATRSSLPPVLLHRNASLRQHCWKTSNCFTREWDVYKVQGKSTTGIGRPSYFKTHPRRQTGRSKIDKKRSWSKAA